MDSDYPKTFDAANPDKELVRRVLHQAWSMDEGGAVEVYAKAWCLRDMELDGWRALEQHMLANDLMEETGEDQYYRMTAKGQDVLSGEDYNPAVVFVVAPAPTCAAPFPAADTDPSSLLRELDESVVREVMGWEMVQHSRHDGEVPRLHYRDAVDNMNYLPEQFRPSESIDDAWQVVARMDRDGFRLMLFEDDGGWNAKFQSDTAIGEGMDCDTAPLAICRAAIKAYIDARIALAAKKG